MRIRSYSMLGTHHSWAVTMRNLLMQFNKMGHQLYLKTTNGDSEIPAELSEYLDRVATKSDLDICYTAPRNFNARFLKRSKVKMAIYNYETSILPKKWLHTINHLDYVLPSSNFSKEVFVNAGWPEKKCLVVPHGINLDDYNNKEVYPIRKKDAFKFLNISIPHHRKNIDLLISAYYDAFREDDNVALILKTSLKKPKKHNRFEVDVKEIIREVQKKYMNKKGGLPHIQILEAKLPSMIPLYNACDAVVSASSAEGFGLPLLEGLAADRLIIAPRCTGQIDFLNDKNSLLVGVKEISAGKKYQYWTPSPGAKTYLPLQDELSGAMLKAFKNKEKLKESFESERIRTINEFTWENAAKKILEVV